MKYRETFEYDIGDSVKIYDIQTKEPISESIVISRYIEDNQAKYQLDDGNVLSTGNLLEFISRESLYIRLEDRLIFVVSEKC